MFKTILFKESHRREASLNWSTGLSTPPALYLFHKYEDIFLRTIKRVKLFIHWRIVAISYIPKRHHPLNSHRFMELNLSFSPRTCQKTDSRIVLTMEYTFSQPPLTTQHLWLLIRRWCVAHLSSINKRTWIGFTWDFVGAIMSRLHKQCLLLLHWIPNPDWLIDWLSSFFTFILMIRSTSY